MNREVFLRCSIFKGMPFEEIFSFINCIGSRSFAFRDGEEICLPDGVVAVVVRDGFKVFDPAMRVFSSLYAGDAVTGGRSFGAACLIRSFGGGELLLIERARLESVCKNGCAFHKKAVSNYISLLERAPYDRILTRITPSIFEILSANASSGARSRSMTV